ncbi:S1C family serine protease [Deinococcus sonorensis]|uniref:Trypsin-like peptidase domain-containing protein n=2 Tax=Deinococcus sonorensis TaxID=309891 RepID=A0AAU7UD27_9DEIO
MNRWPLLALPVAAAIVAVPFLPAQDHATGTLTAQEQGSPQTSAPTLTTPEQAAPTQSSPSETAPDSTTTPDLDTQNPWQPDSPFADQGQGLPDQGQLPWRRNQTPQTQQGSATSTLSSTTRAALKRVYEQSTAAAVRVNVGDSGIGSGYFMTSDGLVLTAAHVPLGDASAQLSVTTADGTQHPATLVGYDEVRDLAVLRAQGSGFSTLRLASRTPSVGDGVVAIGNSRGSFDGGRAGAVTAVNATLDPTFPNNLVVSSMPLAPGDSGGPVLNAQGEVVGISTAISEQNGQFNSYFVPVTRSTTLLRDLIAGTKRGVPVLGISVADARQYGSGSGILVTGVTPGLGAAKAGLKASVVSEYRDDSGAVQQDTSGADVIVGVDGRSVSTPTALIAYLRGKQVGDRVTLRVVRGGQTQNLTVTLSARPSGES